MELLNSLSTKGGFTPPQRKVEVIGVGRWSCSRPVLHGPRMRHGRDVHRNVFQCPP